MLLALANPRQVQITGVSERVWGALARAQWLPADTGRAAASPQVILEKHHPRNEIRVSPSLLSPQLVDWGLRVQRQHFQVPTSVSDLAAFCRLGGFYADLSPTGSQRSSRRGVYWGASIWKGHVGTRPKRLSEMLMSHRWSALSWSLPIWPSRAFC